MSAFVNIRLFGRYPCPYSDKYYHVGQTLIGPNGKSLVFTEIIPRSDGTVSYFRYKEASQ